VVEVVEEKKIAVPRGGLLAWLDPEAILRIVRESRNDQGLPERITEPSVLSRLAILVRGR